MKMTFGERSTMVHAEGHGRNATSRWRLIGIALFCLSAIAVVGNIVVVPTDQDSGFGRAAEIASIVSLPVVLVFLALGLTWLARRNASRGPHLSAADSTVTGRSLAVVRSFLVVVFAAAAILYTADAFALWDEAHRLQTADQYGEAIDYYGLTLQERSLLTGSTAEVPGWYPAFVVARQVVLDVVAVGIAWLIFWRRPKHWMAYLSTLFILLAPWSGHLIRSSDRLGDTSVGWLADGFSWLAALTLAAFLWLFPDGRFRATFLRYVAGLAAVYLGIWSLASLLGDEDAHDGAGWITFMLAFLILGLGGIALQAWRYRHARLADRRLARWNVALLVAIPLWLLPFDALHDFLGEEDETRDDTFGFAWEQIHETLYLAVPVLLGVWVLYLVRRQGWWDFQTLWNRTAIYGIGLVLLAAVYTAAFGLVVLAASPLGEAGEQAVAVLVATAAVAFAYGPLIGGIRARVDQRWFPRRVEIERLASEFGVDMRRSPTPASVPEQLQAFVAVSLDTDAVELWLAPGSDRP